MNLNPLKKLHKARKINTFENFIKSIILWMARDQKIPEGGYRTKGYSQGIRVFETENSWTLLDFIS
jgi:hypothetical protein